MKDPKACEGLTSLPGGACIGFYSVPHPRRSMKILLIILDGVGDRPSPTIGGRTPLQAARTPVISRLASEGVTGIMDPVSPGIPVGSDTGHLALLGYDPHIYYTGRGPLEALGVGLDLVPGDVAFRCNFATVDEGWGVIDRRAGRISSEEAAELAEAAEEVCSSMKSDVELLFKHTVEHRGVLLMRGESLPEKVPDVDPHREGVKARLPEPRDKATALLREFLLKTHQALSSHPVNIERIKKGLRPANALLPRGGGRAPSLPRLGGGSLSGAVVAGGAIYKGVCKAAGMDVLEAPGATGTINTNLPSKFRTALDALRRYDFVLLHIKGTDSASHDKNPRLKAEFIGRVDDAFSGVVDRLSDVIVCVTGDHTTSSTIGMHRGDPVPLLINGEGVRRDDVASFDEISCARGGLGRIRGTDLLNILMDLANLSEMYGE